jgi:hypothetical protein
MDDNVMHIFGFVIKPIHPVERLPVYQETAKELNVELYCKLGFKLVGEWDVPTGGPHFWSLLYEN